MTSAAPIHEGGKGASRSKGSGWLAQHKNEALLGGVVGVGALALYARSRSATAAGTTTAAGVPIATSATPATADTTSLDLYNQIESQIYGLGNQLNGLTSTNQMKTQPNQPAPTQASNPPPQPSGATPVQHPQISIGGVGYTELGQLGPYEAGNQIEYSGYGALAGAPVFFGNGNGVSQGTGQMTPGNFAYIQTSQANLISPTAAVNGSLPR